MENIKAEKTTLVSGSQNRIVRQLPAVMSMTDLRLLHHFLIYATPHIPPGNTQVWTHEVAAHAHEVSRWRLANLARPYGDRRMG